MATDKKHIAVYLDKAVEDALTAFCAKNGLEGKKGPMYSAAVNKALAKYFGITPSNTPDNTQRNTPSDILDTISSNILEQRLAETEQRLTKQVAALEERLGKLKA